MFLENITNQKWIVYYLEDDITIKKIFDLQ